MGTVLNLNEHTVGIRIQFEIARWFESRKAAEQPNPKLVALMPLTFRTLDALYLETRNLPLVGVSGANKNKLKDKPDVFTFGLILESTEYRTLRSILALAGDLALVLHQLKSLRQPPDVGQFIKPLHERADKFREARHFFSHMEEAFRDYSIHAAPVPHDLNCGVKFGANATNNIYLIWENGTVYFSYDKRHCQVNVDTPEFNEIFKLARELYAKIIDNPLSLRFREFKDPAQIYPD